jgi:hypothetical protein
MGNKAFRYSPEHIAFLSEGFMTMSPTPLAVAFKDKFDIDKTPGQIHSALKGRGITCGRNSGEIMKGKSKIFTPEQVDWFKTNYLLLSRRDLTAAFNKKFNQNREEKQVITFLKNNSIHSGRTAHFKKGVPSWAKGTRGVLKANSGSFKEGQHAHNHVPVGSERIVKGGYTEVKTAEPHTWIGKNRITWEESHGTIPKNHNIRFRDGNPENLTIDNLFMVNKSEHQILNAMKFIEQPDQVKDTTVLMARIRSKTIQLSDRGAA